MVGTAVDAAHGITGVAVAAMDAQTGIGAAVLQTC